MSMGLVLPIAAGGALGAVLRYLVAGVLLRPATEGFPYGTMAVNVLGSLLIGIIAGWFFREIQEVRPALQAFLVTGLLGGFTTFSAFSLETIMLMQRGDYAVALSYIFASLVLCVGACALGFMLLKAL